MPRSFSKERKKRSKMPLPLLFIGIAAVTGATGIGTTIKAGVDQTKANHITSDANERVERAALRLDDLRKQCGQTLDALGGEKLFVLNGNMTEFVNEFQKLKNVDFSDSVGLSELSKFHVDQKEFEEMAEMTSFAASLSTGIASGAAGGALAAFGAYSAASSLALASTGTAISTLSGVAASNATLAFFGGGSLAAGGLGVAGGTAVLGGLVAGPALLVLGIITSAKAGKNLENAKANAAIADETCEELETGAFQCISIRRRTNMFYCLLARLDAYFLPLLHKMKEIIKTEGTNYTCFIPESKKVIASAASIAVSIKAVLDTPILSESGELTEESKLICSSTEQTLKRVNQQ